MIEIAVKKSYNKVPVLDVDFTLEEGKRYAIIGANGSGKTTLLKIIAGAETSDDGKIIIPKDICFMPQNSYGFSLSVRNNVLLSIKGQSIFSKAERKKYEEKATLLMKKLHIDDLAKKNGSRLSGGETQKTALARCLILSHSVLLLDEPTSSMDISSTATAEEVINSYYEENKPTIIFATHSIRQAERLADVVIFMQDGKIIEIGEDVISNPQTAELKLFLANS